MNIETLKSLVSPLQTMGPEIRRFGGLTDDSRTVEPGDLFVAVRGSITDGHHYVRNALERGAGGVLAEVLPDVLAADYPNVWFARIEDTRSILGPLAHAWYGHPSRELKMMGVTGTNGKTTVATLIWQLSEAAGERCALLGTTGKWFGRDAESSRLTTSGPVELARDLRTAIDRGCERLVMEVSSHALDQERTQGVEWDVAGFTNLSHDHLDYHQTMERYAAAKRKLFEQLPTDATAVLHLDDPYGAYMADACRSRVQQFSFEQDADVRCILERSGPDGQTLKIGSRTVQTPLVGAYNAQNLVTAMLMCDATGLSLDRLIPLASRATGAPGRLERVEPMHRSPGSGADTRPLLPTVFVDYAHTPDALEQVSKALAEIKPTGSTFILVFGCGGDRDRSKRPEMARAAELHADRIVLTSDNPRMEDPDAILDEIMHGFSSNLPVTRIVSRKEAIQTTIRTAPDGALVLIAGRGHETEQQAGGRRIPLDDRIEARRALEERLSNSAPSEEATC
ncbi:MAG: UDP-N-acetylmuramoyl-L-alanyl-D-glutamate--2,6-diaminopimelate ligase [Balneolaceae bacterium]